MSGWSCYIIFVTFLYIPIPYCEFMRYRFHAVKREPQQTMPRIYYKEIINCLFIDSIESYRHLPEVAVCVIKNLFCVLEMCRETHNHYSFSVIDPEFYVNGYTWNGNGYTNKPYTAA